MSVQLVHTAFAYAQYFADFFEGETLEIVKRDDQALALWKVLHTCSQDSPNLSPLDFPTRVAGFIYEQFDEVNRIVAVAAAQNVIQRVNVGSARLQVDRIRSPEPSLCGRELSASRESIEEPSPRLATFPESHHE